MFKNLTIKSRLIYLIAFLSLLLIVIGVLGLRGMQQSNEGLRSVYQDRTIPLDQIAEISDLMSQNIRQLHLASMHDPRMEESKLHDHPIAMHTDKVEENIGKISVIWDAYMATYLTPDEKIIADDYLAKRKAFVNDGLKVAVGLYKQARYAEGNASMIKVVGPLGNAALERADDLKTLQIDVAKEEFEKAEKAYGASRLIAIVAILLGIVLAALFGFFLVRNLSRSLAQAGDVASKIAAGDLSSQIKVENNDEVGALLHSMEAMQVSLRGIVSEIKDIVAAANRGDFDTKMKMEGKAGYTQELSELLNQLSNTVDGAFKDTIRVADALAKGDLTQKITKEYAGAYNQVKVSVNTTADSLTQIVAEIQQIVEAATKGDFSTKMDLSGKQGYTKTLSELLNLLSDTVDTAFKDTIHVAQALAKGDLTQVVTREYQGSFNDVKQSLNGTVTNLKELVGQIKDATDTINTASKEIASGNSDLPTSLLVVVQGSVSGTILR
jgi:methyl-accepting chemotaxis protein